MLRPSREPEPLTSLHIVGGLDVPDLEETRFAEPAAGWRAGKRVIDVLLSITALLLALPLMLVIAVAIKADSPGPIFYRVRRCGYRGRPLMMLKFRKMRDGASGAPLTARTDRRLTKVGAFLTRSRLDELPQFWDVLCGRMSFIGPRPEDPQFVALHHAEYTRILSVRPGIIGLSQLAYEAESTIVSVEDPVQDYVDRILPQKLTLDQLYAGSTRPVLDLSILKWAIVALVMRRPVAVSRTTGAMGVRKPRTAWTRAEDATAHRIHLRWTGPPGDRRIAMLATVATPATDTEPTRATDVGDGDELAERSA